MERKHILIIVDMVKGFVEFGNLADQRIDRITLPIVDKIEEAIDNKYEIVAFVDTHTTTRENFVEFVSENYRASKSILAHVAEHGKQSEEFSVYPLHCLKGTPECELVEEINNYSDYIKIFEKDSTNGLNERKFKDYLSKLGNSAGIEKIEIVGCCTDICVKNLAISLYDYLNNEMEVAGLKTQIVVDSKYVETFDSENHKASTEQTKALKEMKLAGIDVITHRRVKETVINRKETYQD